ncbi:tyrosine--tRNA ligase [bacterium]|nr:tyrosine--tRNA ligase [bacterium]
MTDIVKQVELLMRGTKFADESAEYGDPSGESVLRARAKSELEERIKKARAKKRPLRIYLGVDPTRESLHIGHMVPAQKLRQFQNLGHQVIFLIGDYTARIGDPSGQASERAQISGEEIDAHASFYTEQAFRILDKSGGLRGGVETLPVEIRNNGEWLAKLDFELIVKLAAMFSLKRITGRRDFQLRMDAGEDVRFHETLYALMQGYDAYMLKCDVQVGAYDQHMNLLAGRTIQEHFGDEPHTMLTMPLLAGTDGRKMSKSWGNTIDLLDTPENMYGKCMRISDDLLPQYIELACGLSPDEKDEMLARLNSDENPMVIKKEVAFNITEQYNGEDAAERAAEHFRKTVQEKAAGDDVPVIEVGAEYMSGGKTLFDFIVDNGLFDGSNRELRRLFEQGGVRVDDVAVTDPKAPIPSALPCVLRIGKRGFFKLK